MRKNSRDDRFTLLAIPETDVELPALPRVAGKRGAAQTCRVEEQAITMTRSLGDFYAHHHGVTWEPEVRVLSRRPDPAKPLGSLGVTIQRQCGSL